MAEIGIIENFHAFHGSNSHDHDFRVEVVLEGKIDPETEYVEGVDHYEVVADVKKIILQLKDRDLKKFLSDQGFKSSGNESTGRFFLKQLIDKYPIKFIRIWETENRYAVVYPEDV